ncbi:MAG: YdcF family protein [Chloroflexota bacterium]
MLARKSYAALPAIGGQDGRSSLLVAFFLFAHLPMFVFLSKLLPPLVYPLGLALIAIPVAVFLQRKPRVQRTLLVAAWLVLLLGSNEFVSMALTRSVEWQYFPPEEFPHAGAIVLLGGGTSPANYPRSTVELNGAGDRVVYAAWLYRQGAAPAILASGGAIDWLETGKSAADDMAFLLDLMGVPEEAIWLEENSRNTAENAAECAKILRKKGITRIILVTSAFHMPRSVPLFENQGFEVIPAPTDYSVTQADWDALTESGPGLLVRLLPSADNLAATSRVLKEYIGMAVYRLRGW